MAAVPRGYRSRQELLDELMLDQLEFADRRSLVRARQVLSESPPAIPSHVNEHDAHDLPRVGPRAMLLQQPDDALLSSARMDRGDIRDFPVFEHRRVISG